MKTTKPIRNALIGASLFISSLLSAQSLTYSAPGGFYEQPFQLTLSCENRDATIHYTTNGNTPTAADPIYHEPLLLDERLCSHSNIFTIRNCPDNMWYLPETVQKCIVIRAAAFNDIGQQIGDIVTNTYLIKSLGCDTHGLPVVSLCVDSLDLFDYERGIFVPGKHFVNWNPDYSGNYYQDGRDWERECNLEFYECDNNGINQKAGVRIQGNGSRRFSQKGLKFYARQEYGSKRFKYKFFADLETDSFKHIKIKPFRSGYEELGCQDYLCSQIARMVQVEHLATRPVILFLNGEYWGIYYLQEKPDERYLEDHFSVDLGQINIIGNWNGLCEYGSNESFLALFDWIESHDLSNEENYAYAASQIDIPNFIDYQILELFIANTDWPANNMRCWKENDGLWRWIYYDGDACLIQPQFNVIANATYAEEGDYYMTNARSTLFFRKLMENETFKIQFISRFYQLMHGAFKYENLKPICDNAISQIAEEIQRQAHRFDNPKMEMDWLESVSIIDRFLAHRNSYFDNILFSDFAHLDQSLEITSIAPNPAKDHLHIHVDADEMVIADIQIFNILGQKLLQTKTILVKGGNEIDFPIDLNGGIFILRIGNASGKFIVIN